MSMGQGSSVTRMKSNQVGGRYGCKLNRFCSFSDVGHRRPAHNDHGSIDVFWPRMLDNVSTDVGARDNASDIRYLCVPSGAEEGEAR